MSVLIKGMELPKNCHNCELLTRIEVTYGAVYACQILNEVIGNVMVRQIRCPLVEIPPHGDLIDRDALPTSRVEWEDIVNAPTIIESEASR